MRAAVSLFICCAVMTMLLVPAPTVIAKDEDQDWRKREAVAKEEVTVDDISEEIRFGREVAARILGRYPLYENDAVMKYVNLVGRSLAMNSSRPELEFRFAVLNTDEINAYAAPGGYVFLTRGALMRMKDEAELAGVLAHEISHIANKHVVRELSIKAKEGSSTAGLARMIGGSSEAARATFSQAVDKAVDMLFTSGYKREDEIDADRTAMQLGTLAGYDPLALVRYFETLKAAKGAKAEILTGTHPSFDDRISWLKTEIAAEGVDPGRLQSYKERFEEVQKQVK